MSSPGLEKTTRQHMGECRVSIIIKALNEEKRIYILDGDMEMLDGFLGPAIDFMLLHQDVAGVGGQVVEQNTESLEYLARTERAAGHMLPGCVDRLDMGGLYRRSAIEDAGYFSNRNLHSYEELDLAIRLRALNWRLWRLPVDVVRHYGHDAPPYQLLMRRWRSHYICGLGELIRATSEWARLRLVLREVRELRLYIAVLVWWAALVSVPFWPATLNFRFVCFFAVFIAPVCVMVWRKRSVRMAVYSVVSWCFNAAGMVKGLLSRQRPARELISSRSIHPADTRQPDPLSGAAG